jgi:ATP-dependent DNA ligase
MTEFKYGDLEGILEGNKFTSKEIISGTNHWKIIIETVYPPVLKGKLNGTAIVRVESKKGVNGKIKLSVGTIISEGRNIGKSNETNVFEQALINARGKYTKQLRLGSSKLTELTESITELTESSKSITDETILPEFIHPQLISNLRSNPELLKPNTKYILQPKLNGTCIMIKNGVAWSRGCLRQTLQPHLNTAIKALPLNITFHGEFYLHGLKCNEISGLSRNKTFSESDPLMKIFLFDIVNDKPQYLRLEELSAIVLPEYIELVPHITITTPIVLPIDLKAYTVLQDYFELWLKQQYEGIVIRDYNSLYVSCLHNRHIKHAFKYKPFYDMEFKCISFDCCSNGKSAGCIILTCITSRGKQFKVRPKNMTIVESKALFIEMCSNFKEKYLNQMYNVEFDEPSPEEIETTDVVPLKAYGVRFRFTL